MRPSAARQAALPQARTRAPGRRRTLRWLPALAASTVLAGLLAAPQALARHDKAARKGEFTFALIGHSFRNDGGDAEFRRLLAEADRAEPAFIIATGIKSASEACSDRLYAERRALMDNAERPLVLLPAGSDWASCRNASGKSSAVERLNRIRELFFAEPEALGSRKLALNRQSAIAKFRDYAENAYWEHENILFVTLNVPARNNHYLTEAGRNSEYEDRMVANRAWLQRVFLLAKRKKLPGIVLVMDGDIGAHVQQGFFARLSQKKDGFTETRRLVRAQAEKFHGRLLLVDSQKQDRSAPAIAWTGNIGHLALGVEGVQLRAGTASPALFAIVTEHSQ